MSHTMLRKSQLEAFKAWLTSNGMEHRPPRGPYQVVQVEIADGSRHAIYCREKDNGFVTVPRPLERTVMQFLRGPSTRHTLPKTLAKPDGPPDPHKARLLQRF